MDPYNGQVCIGARKIAWKSLDNGQESLKGLAANGHGNITSYQGKSLFISDGNTMTVHIKAE